MTEPEINFKTAFLFSSTGDEERAISQLVTPDQVLITLAVPETSSKEDYPETDEENHDNVPGDLVSLGSGVKYIRESGTIISKTYGYPIVSHTQNQRLSISIEPCIYVHTDKMEATLTLSPPVDKEDDLEAQHIQQALAHSRVIYGIDQDGINDLINTAQNGTQQFVSTTIARGRAPIPGKNAFLRFEVEIGPIAGQVLANGNIDFRERRMFVGVKEDQIIARKIPATEGADGVNLYGDPIPAQSGKDLAVEVSDDTSFCEETGAILATASGILSIVNEKNIKVSSKQTIDGDVGFATGNIRSQNSVEVTGSVLPDFIVSTKGDLLIRTNVQSSLINTRGNLVVKGGVIGPGSLARVRGDADLGYIERGQLIAGGNIVLRSSGYYSDLQATGNMFCPEKTKLVGGAIIIGGSLTTGQVGSNRSEPMLVAVGTDHKRLKWYKQLQKQYFQLIKEIKTWENRYGTHHEKDKKHMSMHEELSELETILTSTNLIPGSKERSLGSLNHFVSSATLTVHGLLAERTKIRIGNETTVVKKNYSSVIVKIDEETGAIQIVPL